MATRRLEELYHDVIECAVSDYGDHSRVTRPKIIRWLKQFPARSRPLAAKILSSLSYYAESNLRSMAQQLVKVAYMEYSEVPKRCIYFVPIGGAGSGAQHVARHLRTIRSVPKASVVDLLDLHRKSPDEVSVVVAFDDFSGTGQAITEWWELNETLIRPKQAEVVIGLLVLNYLARPSLEEITEQLMSVEELLEDANVFHENSTLLSAGEKERLLRLCRRTGCTEDYVRGRGGCALLVVLKHGCPNNSIPILWHHRPGVWEALFQRRST